MHLQYCLYKHLKVLFNSTKYLSIIYYLLTLVDFKTVYDSHQVCMTSLGQTKRHMFPVLLSLRMKGTSVLPIG